MEFNSKGIILFIMLVSVLLFCVSGVCAQDFNANSMMDMGKIPIFDDETLDVGTTDSMMDMGKISIFDDETLDVGTTDSMMDMGKIPIFDDEISDVDTFDDLQVEINKATEGSVLTLTRDYIGGYGSGIQLDKDLTIDGHGHTIDCLNRSSAFYSGSGNIILMNLNIINGSKGSYLNLESGVSDQGGAIHISGSAQYTIINCTFNNNWADNNGGAIYNCVHKPLIIINSTFSNNSAIYYHGKTIDKLKEAAYDSIGCGGAIYSVGRVYLENSIFESNSAYLNGGAIWCKDGFNVNKCLFEFNKASSEIHRWFLMPRGGAIYCNGTNTNNYINNSIFKNNHADERGGAIYSALSGNLKNLHSLNVFNSTFLDNQAKFSGGAICGDIVNIVNSTFNSNECTYTSLLGRWATGQGGGAVNAMRVTIDSSEFDNNCVGLAGGAIHSTYIKFKGENIFRSNTAGSQGGAIHTVSIEGDVKGVTFASNFAKYDGGAISIFGEYDGTFSNCIFDKNRANGMGGAIYVDSHSSDITLTHNIFTENMAAIGNSGYTCNIGGIGRTSFILGPNYYGETADCRKNQFYFSKIELDFLSNPFSAPSGDELRVKTWFNTALDMCNNKVEVDDGVTYEDVKLWINQCCDWAQTYICGGRFSMHPFNPIVESVRGIVYIVDFFKNLF